MQFFRWHKDVADKHHMMYDVLRCLVYHIVIISQLNICDMFFFFFCENVSAVGVPKDLVQVSDFQSYEKYRFKIQIP